MTNKTEVPALVQSLPSLTMIGAWVASKDYQWWLAMLGGVFVAVQLAHKLWSWRNEWIDRRAARRGRISTRR